MSSTKTSNRQRKPKPQAKKAKVVLVRTIVKKPTRRKQVKVRKNSRLAVVNAHRKNLNQLGGSNTMKQLMYNFLAPCDGHGFRWPAEGNEGVPSGTQTGTVHLKSINQVNTANGFIGTYSDNDTGIQLAYLFRQPLRSAVVLKVNSAPVDYTAYFKNATTTHTPVSGQTFHVLPIAYLKAPDSTAPHGEFLYTGTLKSLDEASFIWMAPTDTLTITYTGTGTPADFYTIFRADEPGTLGCTTSRVDTISFTSITSETFSPTTSGYYAITAANGTATVTWTVGVKLTVGAGDVMSHVPIPGAHTHPEYLGSCRILSASILCSNVAAPLVQEGMVHGASITDGSPFYKYTITNDISGKTDYFADKAATGIYSWLRPGPNAFVYRQCLEVDTAGSITDSNFQLDDGTEYQVIMIRSTATSGTTHAGLDFMMALHWNLEFKTDDQWRDLAYSPYRLADANDALQRAVRCQTFCENPLHLKQIRDFVVKSGKLLRAHSKSIGGVLSAMFPQYSNMIGPAARFLQS